MTETGRGQNSGRRKREQAALRASKANHLGLNASPQPDTNTLGIVGHDV